MKYLIFNNIFLRGHHDKSKGEKETIAGIQNKAIPSLNTYILVIYDISRYIKVKKNSVVQYVKRKTISF